MRAIRADVVARLRAVESIGQVPLDLGTEIREQAANLLRDPRAYAYRGPCGGGDPNTKPSFTQETRIAHYEE